MLLVPDQIHPSWFPYFTLVLTLTCLTSFGGHKYALAQFPGPNGPEGPFIGANPDFQDGLASSDYPGDPAIRTSFSRTGLGQSLFVAVSEGYPYRYDVYCERMVCIAETFPDGFLERRERSQEWFRDFLARCHALYMQKTRGTVYILTDTGQAPEYCTYFRSMINHLKSVEAVTSIILVAVGDWQDRLLYWKREDDANQDNRRVKAPGEVEIHPLTTIGGGGAAVGGSLGLDGIYSNAVEKSTFDPVFHYLFGNGLDQPDSGWTPDVKTDAVLSNTASLPSSDDQLIGSTSGETTGIDKALDQIDGTVKTDDQGAVSKNLDARNILRRRRPALLPRDSDDCMDWMKNLDFSSNLSPPDAVVGLVHDTSPDSKTVALAQEEWNPERLLAPFDVKEDVVTLSVVQHGKTAQNPNFVLDISISYQGKTIDDQPGVPAPTKEQIKVPIPLRDPILAPDSPIVSAGFTWPIYLSTGETDEDPLTIEYGDFLMYVSGRTGVSKTFDSNNQKICHVDEWVNSQREIKCSINVAHKL